MIDGYLLNLLHRYKNQRDYLEIARQREISGREKAATIEHVIACADALARQLELEINAEEASVNEHAHVGGNE